MIFIAIVAGVIGFRMGLSHRHLVAVLRAALGISLVTLIAGFASGVTGISLFAAAFFHACALQLMYIIALSCESRLKASIQASQSRRTGLARFR